MRGAAVLATLLEVLGFGLLVAGVALVSVPAAFVTAGVLLLVAAVALDPRRSKS